MAHQEFIPYSRKSLVRGWARVNEMRQIIPNKAVRADWLAQIPAANEKNAPPKEGIDRVEDSGYAGKLIVIISFIRKSFIVNPLSISDNWRE